jgi:uncharacterized membrane protein
VKELFLGLLLSMAPVVELQGGIPVAMASGLNPWLVFILCYLANILVIPIIYFFLEIIHHRLLHVNSYQSWFDKIMERCRKKVHPYIDKYGMVGFMLFVAIPTPGTGAYTATLGAWFLGMHKWPAFVSIALGILINALIVFGVAFGGYKLFSVI